MHSPLDYTFLVRRKKGYFVVSCPEFGLQVGADLVRLRELNAESIGNAVLKVISGVSHQIDQMKQDGKEQPRPLNTVRLLGKDLVSSKEACRILGISRPTLRRLVYQGTLRAERTPGGHMRISLEAISDYLVA